MARVENGRAILGATEEEDARVGRSRGAACLGLGVLTLVGVAFAASRGAGEPETHAKAPMAASLDVISAEASDDVGGGCHDVNPSEHGPCLTEINAIKKKGVIPSVKRFTGGIGGLKVPDRSAPLVEWQELAYKTSRGKCPRPCTMEKSKYCAKGDVAPAMWNASFPSETLQIKILSYNLFWWNLFGVKKATYKNIKNAPGKLIAESMTPAYDVMGFQECENITKVLGPVGLLEQYIGLQGTHAVCIAFNKETWSLINSGEEDVAEDQASEYYGLRAAQWVRLNHIKTGSKLLFVNHHGPLHVNSGGECGGVSTAHNLLNLIASKAEVGDAVVLVGDFNADAGSLTIQELWKHLVLLFTGDSFGGVDNIFSNLGYKTLREKLKVGSAGSDHDAISATVEWRSWGTPPLRGTLPDDQSVAATKAVEVSVDTECGLLEPSVEYSFHETTFTQHVTGVTARRCCSLCKKEESCKAWVFRDYAELKAVNGHGPSKGPVCTLKGGEVAVKWPKDGVVSGLPPAEASKAAEKAEVLAITEIYRDY